MRLDSNFAHLDGATAKNLRDVTKPPNYDFQHIGLHLRNIGDCSNLPFFIKGKGTSFNALF